MPPADPRTLLPQPVQTATNRTDPFHQEPAMALAPYRTPEEIAEAEKAEREKAHELSLDEAKAELNKLSRELRTADAKRVKPLALQIQRLRVTILLLQEAHSGIADPSTYRELSLLAKMVEDKGLDDMTEQDARDAAQQVASEREARLASRGGDIASANRIVRLLQSVMNDGSSLKPHGPDSTPAKPAA
jgi:hypothetical protein